MHLPLLKALSQEKVIQILTTYFKPFLQLDSNIPPVLSSMKKP